MVVSNKAPISTLAERSSDKRWKIITPIALVSMTIILLQAFKLIAVEGSIIMCHMVDTIVLAI
jgi:hypothetical protein